MHPPDTPHRTGRPAALWRRHPAVRRQDLLIAVQQATVQPAVRQVAVQPAVRQAAVRIVRLRRQPTPVRQRQHHPHPHGVHLLPHRVPPLRYVPLKVAVQ